MKKVAQQLLYSSLLIILVGCAPKPEFKTYYELYLDKSDSTSLQFKDDKFKFFFTPVPSGVWFTIINPNSKPGFLEWDRCYFIKPDGNSSKALNPDELEENSETTAKAKYESPLPSTGRFTRFTTSVENIKKYQNTEVSQFITTYMYRNGETDISTKTNIDMRRITQITGSYWPEFTPVFDTSASNEGGLLDSLEMPSLSLIRNYVKDYNNMGLGIGIKFNDTILDYKFDFKFKSVTINQETQTDSGLKIQKYKSASESNGWLWE